VCVCAWTLIIITINNNKTTTHTNVYSIDGGLSFATLPAVCPKDVFVHSVAPRVRGLFSGDPSRKYRNPLLPADEDELSDEELARGDAKQQQQEQKQKKKQVRKLTEQERLWYTVNAIDDACSVVPRGALVCTPTRAFRKNNAFRGLACKAALDLQSYLLLRTPVLLSTQASLRKHAATNNAACLDSVADAGAVAFAGKTRRLWSIRADNSGMNVTLRSLLWPGYEFQLQALHRTKYTGAYYGTGERNDDIVFML
jgi:hypothetical protein